MPDVFICHSSKDFDIAMKLVENLESGGLDCWIAPRNITPGSDWAASISSALTATKVFLVVFSRNSRDSEQCARELGIAETLKGVTVVPYRIDNAELTGSYQYYLTSAHWVIADHKKKDYKYTELINFISECVGKKPKSAEPEPPVQAAAVPAQSHAEQPKNASADNRPEKKTNKAMIVLLSVCGVLVAGVAALIIVLASRDSGAPVPASPSQTDVSSQTQAPDTQVPQQTDAPAVSSSAPTAAPVTEEAAATAPRETTVSTTTTKATTAGTTTAKTEPKPDLSEYVFSFAGTDCTGEYNGGTDENGLPDGSGEFTGRDALGDTFSYVGEFRKGFADGEGTLKISNVKAPDREYSYDVDYKGFFRSGLYDGTGFYKATATSDTYFEYYTLDGIFSKGMAITGFFEQKNTEAVGSEFTYEGEINALVNNEASFEFTGKGKYHVTEANGTIVEYDGEAVNSVYNGKGKLTRTDTNGEKLEYEGVFKDMLITGEGKMKHYKNERLVSEYEGNFEKGVLNGHGRLIKHREDGSYTDYEGDFRNGVYDGKGRYVEKDADGKTLVEKEGRFSKGEFVGE